VLSIGDIIRGTVDTLAFGGEGIVRHNGMVIFIPFVAIGDELEVSVVDVKKSFARARVLKKLTLGPNRITPQCKHFGVCGGCQLQYLNYQTQLDLKQTWVRDSLKKIAGLSNFDVSPTIGTEEQWHYRRVVKLRFGLDLKLAYVNAESNGQVKVETCPIFTADDALWAQFNTFLPVLCSQAESGLVSIYKADNENYVASIDVQTDSMLNRNAALPALLKGCMLRTPSESFDIGDTSLRFEQHGLAFQYTPLSFVQNHAEQSAKISESVVNAVIASGAQRVFDLYCGFGVTAIALAKKGARVVGVENNPESIRLARLNAATNGANAEWVCDDVAKVILTLLKRHKPDAIIVNPPRTGLASKVTSALLESDARTIVYVSCMPQTLARDLKVLCGKYRIDDCQPYDMFPQTTHVETVVVLTLDR